MNILPKKRWHVRTKENIARVRKDEAEAAEKEKQEKIRTETADREARLAILKQKSKHRLESFNIIESEPEKSTVTSESEHINLFSDLDHAVKTSNLEHDKDVKDQKEEYEKKVGYLTYLGQDTNEALKKKNWYEVMPEASRFSRSNDIKDTYDKLVLKDAEGKPKQKDLDVKYGEIGWKAKQRLDPMNSFRSYCHKKAEDLNEKRNDTNPISTKKNCISNTVLENHKSLHKKKKERRKDKHEKLKDEKEKKMLKLREARLKREQQERYRTQMFLSGQHKSKVSNIDGEKCTRKVKPKYNSQFNPELARQNYR